MIHIVKKFRSSYRVNIIKNLLFERYKLFEYKNIY